MSLREEFTIRILAARLTVTDNYLESITKQTCIEAVRVAETLISVLMETMPASKPIPPVGTGYTHKKG